MNETQAQIPGRHCPIRYRYGAQAIAGAPARAAQTLYVVGGLYGNTAALQTVLEMAAAEPVPPRLCFNGDFNWFDIDDGSFDAINTAVLAHDALAGNVEAELGAGNAGQAGCGCAYPDTVDEATVSRSNRIHARLRECAMRHPELVAALSQLPMFARYEVGLLRVGVVHGDAESLAGWRFGQVALDQPGGLDWLAMACDIADVDLFASSHTCLPVMRQAHRHGGLAAVINNGAAGMPNFRDTGFGLLSRISTTPSPIPAAYGMQTGDVFIDALPIHYDRERWLAQFERNWPPGSDAWASYADRIRKGPDWLPEQADSRGHTRPSFESTAGIRI
jgi:hypothetical protein